MLAGSRVLVAAEAVLRKMPGEVGRAIETVVAVVVLSRFCCGFGE